METEKNGNVRKSASQSQGEGTISSHRKSMKGTALLLLALVASVGLSSGIPISKNIIPDVEKKLHDTFVEWKSEVSARDVRDDEEASSSP